MPTYVLVLNKFLAIGTISLQVIILMLIINLIFFRSSQNKILNFFRNYTLVLGLLASFGSVLLSLFYSEIVGFPPCELCWIQRIFLYPQLVLFGLGLYKKDKSIFDYSLVLAFLGVITSVYHMFVEAGITSGPACADPLNGGVSCSIRYIYEFGYVTMPLMALTLSLFIIVIILNNKFNLDKLK